MSSEKTNDNIPQKVAANDPKPDQEQQRKDAKDKEVQASEGQ